MVKVTSFSEQTYRELKKNEEEGESLSDVVLKMAGRKRRSISGFVGGWRGGRPGQDRSGFEGTEAVGSERGARTLIALL